jgi:hypothetical protein
MGNWVARVEDIRSEFSFPELHEIGVSLDGIDDLVKFG